MATHTIGLSGEGNTLRHYSSVAKLLKKQKGKCTFCGLHFQPEDKIEVDHHKPKAMGGDDKLSNKRALHRHCHDTKTANDLKIIQLHKNGQSQSDMDQEEIIESSKAGCQSTLRSRVP